MFTINWEIKFKTEGKTYSLNTVESVNIESSVENLVDTATIILPETVMNSVLNINDQVKRNSEVVIKMGYDGALKTEFSGYVLDVKTDGGSLKINCEDALSIFKKKVKNVEIKPASVSKVANQLIKQIDSSFKLVCNHDIGYDKFIINEETAYDVLKRLADDTKANIYFNTDKKELHIHAPFSERGEKVTYDMSKNVEKSSLEYVLQIDKKIFITVENTNAKGEVVKATAGDEKGEQVNIKVGSVDKAHLQKVANAELIRRSANGYEGTIDTWLIPFVQPTYIAKIIDKDYPLNEGEYYVISVVTDMSSSGCKRTIKLGVKVEDK